MGQRQSVEFDFDLTPQPTQGSDSRFESFQAYNESGSAIALGDLLMLDRATTTKGVARHVKQWDASTGDEHEVVGVALEAIADTSWGRVAHAGLVAGVNVVATAVAGDKLVPSPTVDGQLAVADPSGEVRRLVGTLTAAQILALNAAAQTLIPAPGAGLYIDVIDLLLSYVYNSVIYGGIAAGEDWSLVYTAAGGVEIGRVETIGFLDQATNQSRLLAYGRAPGAVGDITPGANAPVLVHQLSAEITNGDTPVTYEIRYEVRNVVPAAGGVGQPVGVLMTTAAAGIVLFKRF